MFQAAGISEFSLNNRSKSSQNTMSPGRRIYELALIVGASLILTIVDCFHPHPHDLLELDVQTCLWVHYADAQPPLLAGHFGQHGRRRHDNHEESDLVERLLDLFPPANATLHFCAVLPQSD